MQNILNQIPAPPQGGPKAPPSILSLLRTVRAPLCVLVLTGAALVLPPQVSDMLAALDDGSNAIGDLLTFHGAMALLALSAWYWSRTLLAARFDVPDNPAARAAILGAWLRGFDLVPRAMYCLAVLIGTGVIMRSGAWSNLVYVVAWAIPLGSAVYVRTIDHRWLLLAAAVAVLGIMGRMLVIQAWTGMAVFLAVMIGAALADALYQKAMRRVQRNAAAPGQPMPKDRFTAWIGRIGRLFLRLIDRAPWPNWISLLLFLVSVSTFVAGLAESFGPSRAGQNTLSAFMAALFPGPGAALASLALIIAPLSVLTFVFDGLDVSFDIAGIRLLKRPPVVSCLAIWTALAPALFSLHTVRIIDPDGPQAVVMPAGRQDLAALFKDWSAHCAPAQGPIRPIIVAVSGGATRAAIWGARVLTEVEAASGDAGPRIFAVSSVSGGSLGVAGYMATLAALPDGERCGKPAARAAQIGLLADPALSRDALGPLLAGALLIDIPRAMVTPIPQVLRKLSGDHQPRGGDRAEALEKAFEHLWSQTDLSGKPDGGVSVLQPVAFDQPYLSLFYKEPAAGLSQKPAAGTPPGPAPIRSGMPLWIANGTDMETGNRVVTVPFNPAGPWPLLAASDALSALKADVPISTAVNNTARFPFLEPSGELLEYTPPKQKTEPPLDTRHAARGTARELIDGGYFDNEGLQTALDLRDWLIHSGSAQVGRPVQPIIVEATADGDPIPDEKIVRCEVSSDDPTGLPGTHLPFQVLAPVLGLNNVRGGHAAVLLRQARDAMCPDDTKPVYRCDEDTGRPIRCTTPDAARQSFFHFYLPGDGTQSVPLNWVLSDRTARFIWQDAMTRAGNPREAWIMRQALRGAPDAADAGGTVSTSPGLPDGRPVVKPIIATFPPSGPGGRPPHA